MAYESNTELPSGVRDNLPNHAQEIWRKAFNNAFDEYKDPSKRRGAESDDEAAAKVAWAAVKKEYHKDSKGDWVPDTKH